MADLFQKYSAPLSSKIIITCRLNTGKLLTVSDFDNFGELSKDLVCKHTDTSDYIYAGAFNSRFDASAFFSSLIDKISIKLSAGKVAYTLFFILENAIESIENNQSYANSFEEDGVKVSVCALYSDEEAKKVDNTTAEDVLPANRIR